MKRLIFPALAVLMAVSGPAFAQDNNTDGQGRRGQQQDNTVRGNRGGNRGGGQQQAAPQLQAAPQQQVQQQAPATNNPPRTRRGFQQQAAPQLQAAPQQVQQQPQQNNNVQRGGTFGRGGFTPPANNNVQNNTRNGSFNNTTQNNTRSGSFNNTTQNNTRNGGFNNNTQNNTRFGNTSNNRNWDQARNLRNYSRAFSAPRRYSAPQPFYWPRGYSYTRFRFGDFLPDIFWARNYWIDDYYYYGLDYPPPGFVWVRFGPDALLIDEFSGEVVEVEYNIFY